MPRPVHFEIPAGDPAKAIAFYESVFGWKFQKWEGPLEYWMISTGETERGIDGGLMRRQAPDQPCVNTIDVTDLDATLATVLQNGGTVAMPKMPVPGVGWLAYCKDLDGHMFGLMQNDPAAA